MIVMNRSPNKKSSVVLFSLHSDFQIFYTKTFFLDLFFTENIETLKIYSFVINNKIAS